MSVVCMKEIKLSSSILVKSDKSGIRETIMDYLNKEEAKKNKTAFKEKQKNKISVLIFCVPSKGR